MNALENILRSGIPCQHAVYHGESRCYKCGAPTDPWTNSFWPDRTTAYQMQVQQQLAQLQALQAQRQAALQAEYLRRTGNYGGQVNMYAEELAHKQRTERIKKELEEEKRIELQKNKERKDLFGEELYALMCETDRLAGLI